MGFPFDQATWDVVTGAMFMGWGGALPGFYTFVGVVACIAILWMGNTSEKVKYEKYISSK